MTRIRVALVTLLAASAIGLPVSAAAQIQVRIDQDQWDRPVLRIGQDYVLRAGSEVGQAVVVFGDATIEGRVDHDLVVVLGKAQIAATAVIDGSLVVIGGAVNIANGAQIGRDLVVVAGAFEAPPGFSPGGQHVIIGGTVFGGRLRELVPWISRGLLWGRLIVPDLPWVWRIVGVVFLVYLLLGLIFHEPVRACAETLAGRPLTAFATGLLVLVLLGPVCVLLAVSIVGLAVIPFVLAALFVSGIVGKAGVARWIGAGVVRQESQNSRPQSLRSFVIGFAVIGLAYTVPVLGFVAWTMAGVLGLGAATLASIAAYRRENPLPAPRTPPGVPPLQPLPPSAAMPASSLSATQEARADAPSPFADDLSSTVPSPAAAAAPRSAADLASFPHAAFLDRLAAFVLDVILVVIVANVLDLTRRDADGRVFMLLLAYHIAFWTWKGTTVGGIICQLRVVRVDGAALRFADALVRGLSSIFSLAVLGLGGLWILRDPERQAWHDRIAGTYVVKVPRNWAL